MTSLESSRIEIVLNAAYNRINHEHIKIGSNMVEFIVSVSSVLECSKYVRVWFRDKLTVILNSVEGLLLNVELDAIFIKK